MVIRWSKRTESCRKGVHGRVNASRRKIIAKGSGDLFGKRLLALDRIVTIQEILLDSLSPISPSRSTRATRKLFQHRFDFAGRNARFVVIDQVHRKEIPRIPKDLPSDA